MTQGACPSCGAAVTFSAGAAQVVVCGHCQTVVVPRGTSFEASGRVARLADTDSPLQLGVTGRYQGVGFRLVGHVQRHAGAAFWDEWFAQLDDGRSAWLAESEGALHLLFPGGEEEGLRAAALEPGTRFKLRRHVFVVEERSRVETPAAEGELPNDVSAAAISQVVDASGPKGIFASLDFGTGEGNPEVFIGLRTDWTELGISPDQLRPRVHAVKLEQIRCPQCNGPLDLKAPDRTLRVACPYCAALLDASAGKLSVLRMLEKPETPSPVPLGAKGTLLGVEWTCLGYQQRSCTVEDVRYPWQEVLLFNRARGFAFLMLSNLHWVLYQPIAAGEVSVKPGSPAYFEGKRYPSFQKVFAVTEAVQGEFYWKVEVGEVVEAMDYVAPPLSISLETTDDEVAFSRGTYLSPKEVQKAFGLEHATHPVGIAPSQPNPHQARFRRTVGWAALYCLFAVALFTLKSASVPRLALVDADFEVPAGATSGSVESMAFASPFDIARKGPVEVSLQAPADQTWFGAQAELVQEETGDVHSVYAEVGHYHGYDSDGSWSEGATEATVRTEPVSPGRYTFRLTPGFAKPMSGVMTGASPWRYHVIVRPTGPPLSLLLCVLLALLLVPLVSLIQSIQFEKARWAESSQGVPP